MSARLHFATSLMLIIMLQGIAGTPLFALEYDGTAGKIAGRVVEAETGEPLIGATVYFE